MTQSAVQITVRGYHEDRFGHVNNARYLEFLEESRWVYIDENGLWEGFFREAGVFPVIVRLTISYRRAAVSGDVLNVTAVLCRAGRRKLTFAQTIAFAASGKVCADAEVECVLLDADTGRPVPLSDDMIHAWPDLAEAIERTSTHGV